MALTWSPDGLRSSHLPDVDVATLKRRLRAHTDSPLIGIDAAPPFVVEAVDRIVGLLSGADDDLTSLQLDPVDITPFSWAVYDALRHVGPGETVTYGELAARAGFAPRGFARAVANALATNPYGVIVPCHRVVAAGNRIGGFSAHGGVATKVRLLQVEARGDAANRPMPYDLTAARQHLRAHDPEMAWLLDTLGDISPRRAPHTTTVGALARSIVFQQLNGRAAASIYARLSTLFRYPIDGPTAVELLHLTDAQLQGAGLSGAKIQALRDLATRALAGEIPDLDDLEALDNESVIAALTPVRGIGRWTVEMLLMFHLGRPDVLPLADFGVRAGLARILDVDQVTASTLAERGERWAPWRSVASWYLWRASELPAR